MYFAILGKHPQISLYELQTIKPEFFPSTKKGIVLFDTKNPEKLKKLWWCIKSGVVVLEKELQWILQDTKIIGIQEETIGKHFKKTIGIKRFKIVKINHTDKEIKEKGKEIINLDNGKYWIVQYYQNIPLYETIDFWKPGRSMNMGMMPAKLTHIMITIGINKQTSSDITIYDPFCGSGTTNLLANALNYNTIGSDINTRYIEQNINRWKTSNLYNSDKEIIFFNQDITKPINTWLFNNKDNIIVTEWRLWPIITKNSSEFDIQKAQQQIQNLYVNFFSTIIKSDIFQTIVCSIPRYIWHNNEHELLLSQTINKLWYKWESINEIYYREDQNIGRKICIIEKG